ncbi:MAG: ABC transporter permease [Cyanobacteria bacterium J06597_1]
MLGTNNIVSSVLAPFRRLPLVALSRRTRRWIASKPLLWPSIAIVVGYVAIALMAPQLSRWELLGDPVEYLSNPVMTAPSPDYPWGTNQQGHDVLARTLHGTRTAFNVVIRGTTFALLFGVPLGLIGGYFGSWLDRILVFAMDALYTLPGLLLAIAVAYILQPGITTVSLAVALAYGPLYFRVVRNQAASIKSRGYVEAAIAAGSSPLTILRRHIFPNVLPSLPVLLTLNAADAISMTASLGFLGLGIPSDIPEWGHDLRLALDAFAAGSGWWTAVFPGLAIALLITSLSLIGESFGGRAQG